MTDPQLLILDEPFDGLDVNSRQQLAALLADLHSAGITLALVLNRFDEIPEFVQFAGVLADCTLSETGEKSSLLQQALVAQLAHSEKLDRHHPAGAGCPTGPSCAGRLGAAYRAQ
ncbi:Putative molybdenum transport ATP-binding protein modF [Klebsiella pneumoniae]|nr:Putative molybdenum transport ATP-binding protein modF [Klebsiella pneumoniae]